MSLVQELGIRQTLKDDFPTYAARCLWIRAKDGEILPLKLNSAQQHIHKALEEQKKKTGRVRALILKGRQQGSSTYTEARFYHIATWHKGIRVFILTHEDEATKNIFEMAKRFYEKTPEPVRPSVKAQNARELYFDLLDSGYRVATAGSRGVGRSATFQCFHGSEVAFWPNADEHAAGAMQAVPNVDGTEIILESTSNGPKGFFYSKWADAVAGRNEYLPIFVPWFWQKEYMRELDNVEFSTEEEEYARAHGLVAEQMAWRRWKIQELRSDGKPGIYAFRREYPATAEEAFSAEVAGALWTRDMIDKNRVWDLPKFRHAHIALDPATTSKKTSDAWGSIAGGVGMDGHLYIYADDTMVASPKTCAQNAVDRYRKDGLQSLIFESNQGGDMVSTIIHEIDKGVLCEGVRASQSKRARAEPIALMYEQGRIHHVGELPALEDEMCTWVSNSNESPNRIDALVWLATKTLLKQNALASPATEGLTRKSPNIFV